MCPGVVRYLWWQRAGACLQYQPAYVCGRTPPPRVYRSQPGGWKAFRAHQEVGLAQLTSLMTRLPRTSFALTGAQRSGALVNLPTWPCFQSPPSVDDNWSQSLFSNHTQSFRDCESSHLKSAFVPIFPNRLRSPARCFSEDS